MRVWGNWDVIRCLINSESIHPGHAVCLIAMHWIICPFVEVLAQFDTFAAFSWRRKFYSLQACHSAISVDGFPNQRPNFPNSKHDLPFGGQEVVCSFRLQTALSVDFARKCLFACLCVFECLCVNVFECCLFVCVWMFVSVICPLFLMLGWVFFHEPWG